jgi:hypothetical protein
MASNPGMRSKGPPLILPKEHEVEQKVRLIQAHRDARAVVARSMQQAKPDIKPNVSITAVEHSLLSLQKLVEGIVAQQDYANKATNANFGRPSDKAVYMPFSVAINAGAQKPVRLVVENNERFYYQGYGCTFIPGTSYQEVIDSDASPFVFAPQSLDTDGAHMGAYGLRGRRVRFEVNIVIKNDTGQNQVYTGFVKGRVSLEGDA